MVAGVTTEPGWERVLAAARRQLERTGGELRGKIGLPDPTDAERRAVIGLTGRHRPPGTGRLTLGLDELDAGLRRTRDEGLIELLTRVGGPLRDRPAEHAREASQRDLALAAAVSGAHGGEPWFTAWLQELAADGTVTRLVRRGEPGLLALATAVLDQLPGDGVPLPVLAERATGDTKALSGGPLAQLVLRALPLRDGVDPPASAEARRALWDAAGVVVDDLASQVLVLNLPAARGTRAWPMRWPGPAAR